MSVLVRAWQRQPHNELAEAIHGHAIWTIEEQLLAEAADSLAMGNWQRQNMPNRPKPKRIPRPWEKAKAQQRLGRDPIPVSQFEDWWDSKTKARRAHGS